MSSTMKNIRYNLYHPVALWLTTLWLLGLINQADAFFFDDPLTSHHNGIVCGDKKDTKLFIYFRYQTYPITKEHTSLMAEFLTPKLFQKLYDKTTPNGYSLSNLIQPGVEVPNIPDGVIAGDEDSYFVFSEIMFPIINQIHGFDPEKAFHETNLDPAGITLSEDAEQRLNKYIVYSSVKALRNITGIPFLSGATTNEYSILTNIMRSATCAMHKGDAPKSNTAGKPRSQSDIMRAKPNEVDKPKVKSKWYSAHYPISSLDPEIKQKVIDKGLFYFQEPTLSSVHTIDYEDDKFSNDYTSLLINNEENLSLWIGNNKDHLQIISTRQDAGIAKAFENFARLHTEIKIQLESMGFSYSHSERLGFITSSPRDIGTAMRASFTLKLPKLSNNMEKLTKIAESFNLEVVGGPGNARSVHYDGPIWEIVNKQKIGSSEVEIINNLILGALSIIAEEESEQIQNG